MVPRVMHYKNTSTSFRVATQHLPRFREEMPPLDFAHAFVLNMPSSIFPLLWPPERVVMGMRTSKKLAAILKTAGGSVELCCVPRKIPDRAIFSFLAEHFVEAWKEDLACAVERYTTFGFDIKLVMHQTTSTAELDVNRCATSLLCEALDVARAKMGRSAPRIREVSVRDVYDGRSRGPFLRLINQLDGSSCLKSLQLIGFYGLFDGNNRDSRSLPTFAKAFKRLPLQKFSLREIVEDEDVDPFIEMLPSLGNLESLELALHTGADGCRCLQSALMSPLPPRLRSLTLRNGVIADLDDALEGSFAKPRGDGITDLTLDAMTVRGGGFQDLKGALGKNKQLQVVRILNTRFSYEGLRELAHALGTLPNLVEVDFSGARFTSMLCPRNLVTQLCMSDKVSLLRLHDVCIEYLHAVSRYEERVLNDGPLLRVLPDYVFVPRTLGTTPVKIGVDGVAEGAAEHALRAYKEDVPGCRWRYIFGRGGDTVALGSNHDVPLEHSQLFFGCISTSDSLQDEEEDDDDGLQELLEGDPLPGDADLSDAD